MEYLVYLIYPLMLAALLVGSRLSKKGEWNDEFMDYSQTKYLQGFLAVCIMLHHIGQEMCAPWQTYKLYPGLEFFVPLGYVFVGIFMLCSGYGLMISFEKKPDYLSKRFFKKRVLPLVIGYYVSAWIFFVVRVLMGQRMSRWDVFCMLSGIKLANPYGWFAFAMPFFYLFFYLSFRFSRKPVLTTTLCVFAYTFLGTCINHNVYLMTGQWWYNCVHMFWVGLLVAKYRSRLFAWAKEKYTLKVVICVLLLHGAWYLTNYLQAVFSYYGEDAGLPMYLTVGCRWMCLLGDMLYTTLVGFFILLVGMKLRIGNRFLGFMGTVTFEFYIIHGLVIELFSYRFCDVVKPIVRITNGALMTAVVFLAAIPLSLGMKKICHVFERDRKKEK